MAKDYLYFKNKAKQAFNARYYIKALEFFSYASAQRSGSESKKENLQFEMLCALTDMALEHEDEARALWEYYQIIAKKNNTEAEETILDLIANFDNNLNLLNLAISHLQNIEVDSSDGVLYEDFLKVAKKIGFKEAFTDLMFSSKIIFTNKNDFLFFVQDLVDYGFRDIAINYFENANKSLFFDKDFMHLYKKILQTQ